jgi:Ni/Fe-hydrogenase 1 B-type cytochrome subunit
MTSATDTAPPSVEPPKPSTALLPRMEEARVHEIETRGVHVYNWGVRAWHWLTVGCLFALGITGYLIGSPLPSVGGEASENFGFGYVRFIHFAAGMVLAVGFLWRVGMTFFATPLHREIFLPRVDKPRFRHDLWAEMKWYMFLRKEPNPAVGHNPIAQLSMFFMFTLPTIFMIVTGLALYAQGAGEGTALDRLFGWVGPVLGGNQALHTYHHLMMWVIAAFTIVHIYAVVRADVMSGQSTISVIVGGYRYFRGKGHFHDEDDKPGKDD